MMDYAAVILGYRRPESLQRTVASVLCQDPAPSRVIVWHNAPSRPWPKSAHCVHVTASENFGCPARHAVAQLLSEPIVAFIDDDLELLDRGILPAMVAALSDEQAPLVGWRGRNVARPPSDRPYSSMSEVPPGPADVVKGLLHATWRTQLPCAFVMSPPPDVRREDDIVLSASIACGSRRCPVVVALPDDGIRVTRDAAGLDRRADHKTRRDAACQWMITHGWIPPSWGAVV